MTTILNWLKNGWRFTGSENLEHPRITQMFFF
jgi:hypothetical protein